MPIQAPSWTEFLSCPICCNEFAANQRLPISLGCGHTICRLCLGTLHNRQCPFDQTSITTDVDNLPINYALLQLVNKTNKTSWDADALGKTPSSVRNLSVEELKCYKLAKKCIENLALHLKPFLANGSMLSKPMQRKLVTLVNCQLMEEEGRLRSMRTARALGERTVTELILQHQNPQQLSSNLWAAVRSRGCQFLGPAMQEEVLKLVLLALQDGSARSRKVLVMFVVQRLEPHFPQASKTSIGHVVQLLYRASCFKVSKRESDSSLMQLKEEFRTYEALRREHDAQIVQIATEAGLRIAPDQWSSLLYGDTIHKSHMQSINDKLQTPSSFAQSVQELVIALQRTGDPANLSVLRTHLKHLAGIDPTLEGISPSWEDVAKSLDAVRQVVIGMVEFVQHHGNRKLQECVAVQSTHNTKYKISLCRDLTVRRNCPRGTSCTFAHSEEELERFRCKNRKNVKPVTNSGASASVQNVCNSNLEFSPHHNHHSPHTEMMYIGEETAVASSSMQFLPLGHGKVRGSFGDGPSPLHLHGHPSTSGVRSMHPMHQSPIPQSSNGVLLSGGGGTPITVLPAHHHFETPFGAMVNFNSAHFPPAPISACNSSADGISQRNFSNPLRPPPIPLNMANANPPNFPNSSTADSGNPMHGTASYSDKYSLGLLGTAKGTPQFYENSKICNDINNGNNNNNNGIFRNQFQSMSQPSANIRPSTNLLWEQSQNSQQAIDSVQSANMIAGVSKNTMFLPDNMNKEINKTLNGQGDGLLTNNKLRVSNNSFLHGPNTNKKNLLSDDRQHTAFWNSNSNSPAVKSHEPLPATHAARIKTTALSFRDRDFVRSDSILEDDSATFDVPNTSAALGGKYGAIGMYKGQNTTTVGNKIYSTWSSTNDHTLSDERTNLDIKQPAGFSVFSDCNENTLAIQLQRLQQLQMYGSNVQSTSQPFDNFCKQVAHSKLTELQYNIGATVAASTALEDKVELDLGLNTLHMMVSSSSDDDNDMNQSSVGDPLLWNSPVRPINANNFWNESPITSSGMTNSTVDRHHSQQEQQQQQVAKKLQVTVEEGNNEGVIDSCRMRDIEMELTEIFDKDWSCADDSGIKLD